MPVGDEAGPRPQKPGTTEHLHSSTWRVLWVQSLLLDREAAVQTRCTLAEGGAGPGNPVKFWTPLASAFLREGVCGCVCGCILFNEWGSVEKVLLKLVFI